MTGPPSPQSGLMSWLGVQTRDEMRLDSCGSVSQVRPALGLFTQVQSKVSL